MRTHYEARTEPHDHTIQSAAPSPSEEHHYPVSYWARLWGFSAKTIREWFRDECGPGILRQQNVGRRSTRDYTTIRISSSAAARVYARHAGQELIH